jgi:hypothetical protein
MKFGEAVNTDTGAAQNATAGDIQGTDKLGIWRGGTAAPNQFWNISVDEFHLALESAITVTNNAALAAVLAAARSAGVTYVTLGRTTAGDGGGGLWRWDSSNLSAQVTADPLSGAWLAPTDASTGASGAFVRLFTDEGYNVLWFGAVNSASGGDGGPDCSPAFDAAIDLAAAWPASSGQRVIAPAGRYRLATGCILPGLVELVGAGMFNTILHCGTADVTTMKLDGGRGGIRDCYIQGAGQSSVTFGCSATSHALDINSNENTVERVRCELGWSALRSAGVDNAVRNVEAAGKSYGPGNVLLAGANWHYRGKFDYSAVVNAYGEIAWASTTAYSPGDVRVVDDYVIGCTVGGTSAGSAPALRNYGFPITDGTVTWVLVCPVGYALCDVTGASVGENLLDNTDMSGVGALSLRVDTAGAAYIDCEEIICALGVSIVSAHSVDIHSSRFGGVTVDVDTGYTGHLTVSGCHGAGSAWDIDIGAGVDNFIISNNDLVGGTITVAAGNSNNYAIADNIRATIADGGTGTAKSVPNSAWTAFAPSFTGFSADPTVTAAYKQIGKVVFVRILTTGAGTSNATGFTISLPVNAVGSIGQRFASGIGADNGSITQITFDVAISTVVLYKGISTTATSWTNSGGKYADLTFAYEAA